LFIKFANYILAYLQRNCKPLSHQLHKLEVYNTAWLFGLTAYTKILKVERIYGNHKVLLLIWCASVIFDLKYL